MLPNPYMLINNELSYFVTCQREAGIPLLTAAQLRAARALLGIDQRRLAILSGLSLPTIQRMESSEGVIRGNVDSLMKLVEALDLAGIELIGEGAASQSGGRGLRLKATSNAATKECRNGSMKATDRRARLA